MRFTKLRLNGFKSFVDPTDLIISDGLTGVVGPNGCGKSNLLEALRWVMGENRPTAMRGGGMEDVIFAGAATRPARHFAEVALQIDNSDRLAPAGFNDSDTLDIVRRITRDVGSAYKANGKDMRARDVQMLFADASTGAHSPALVRQGQISELINAKPKNRRRILEDAAGIGGLYQRRHEAELKLKSTEANLLRVDDVIEQLANQLAALARQARQAARYREIGDALRRAEALLLYRRWRDADALRLAAEQDLSQRTTAAAQAEQTARAATTAREKADAALPPLREEEAIAAAILQRLSVERDTLTNDETRARDTIATLTARIGQLTRDIDREAGLNSDAGDSIARLTEEQTNLTAQGDGHDDALAEAADAARQATEILQAREADLTQITEDVARLAARHQSAQRLLADSRKTLDRAETEAARVRDARERAEQTVATARDARKKAEADQTAAAAMAARAEAVLTSGEAARAEAQALEADARAARSEAEGEMNALRAETQALSRLLDRDSHDGSQLIDSVQVDAGLEKALGAALADDLRAPLRTEMSGSGWAALPDYDAPQPLPAGVTALAAHVRAPGVLTRRLGQIGLVAAADGTRLQAQLQPGQRLVSRDGDLWRWDGYCAAAADAPTAAALRLEQVNRLETLKQDMARATARLEGTRAAHDRLSARLADLTRADKEARQALRDADAALTQAQRTLNRAEADQNLAEGKLESLGLAVRRHEDEATLARKQLAEAQKATDGLDDLDAARARAGDIRVTVEAARMTMMARRSAHDELRREGEARTARLAQIARDIAGWTQRLASAETRVAELAERRAASERDLAAAQALPEELAAKRAALTDRMAQAEARKAAAQDALSAAEEAQRTALRDERDAERAASDAREARARSEARMDAARDAVETALQRMSDDLDLTPDTLLARFGIVPDDLAEAETLDADVNRLKRQRDALGAVNLRAEEDAREVQAEHDTLVTEKADLDEAVRTLRTGIASLNREGRERLLTAFEQVNSNFSLLFTHLFGGGEANLVMVESEDPLEAGLEIMCQPPGKKLSTLSLLSGGEQTLTARALIFAVFLANPAPICVLDEVDAPLDDANVTRFCDLLDEMCRRTDTRFLIITHHAVTMSRMDRLFGVTMQEQGVSQLVSVDLKRAEKLVA